MFALAGLLPFVLSAASAIAGPAVSSRSNSCTGLPSGSYNTLATFSLALYYTDGIHANMNLTGFPLVVAQSGGVVSGATLFSFQLWNDVHENYNPALNLANGVLSATNGQLVGDPVSPNTGVYLLATSPTPPAQQVYCVAHTASGAPILAAHGRTDLFSACLRYGSQREVVYDIPASTSEFTDCRPVNLNIVI